MDKRLLVVADQTEPFAKWIGHIWLINLCGGWSSFGDVL